MNKLKQKLRDWLLKEEEIQTFNRPSQPTIENNPNLFEELQVTFDDLLSKEPVKETKEESEEIKITIVGTQVDPEKGIKIELDWNDGFIQYLRESGITGSSEDTMVQKWLTLLYKDIVDEMSASDDSQGAA